MHRDATDSTINIGHTGRGTERSRKKKSDVDMKDACKHYPAKMETIKLRRYL